MHYNLSVVGMRLRVESQAYVSGNTQNILTAKVSFSEDWAGFAKWLHFRRGAEDFEPILLDANDEITADKGLNLSEGLWTIWVHGDKGDKRLTTGLQQVRVYKTGTLPDGAQFEVPTAGDQIVMRAEEYAQQAGQAVAAVEQHAGAAAGSAEAAEAAARAAADSAREAGEQVQAAANSADQAALFEAYAGRSAAAARTAQTAAEESASRAAAANAASDTARAKAEAAALAARNAETAAEQSKVDAQTAKTEAGWHAAAAAAALDELKRGIAEGDFKGEPGEPGEPGKDYVITEADYEAIGAEVEEKYTQQLQTLKEDIYAVQSRLDTVDEVIIETVEPLQKQADNTDRKLDALYKLTQGQAWDEEFRTESGLNDAPTGAKYMTIEEVHGKTEQAQYNGINLIPPPKDKTWAGLTSSFDAENNIIYARGTAKLTGYFDVHQVGDIDNWQDVNAEHITIPKGNVISYGSEWDDGYSFTAVISYYKNGTFTTVFSTSAVNTILQSESLDIYRMFSRISMYAGNTYDVKMAAAFTGAKYEPYVGGIPSPNPDYPQDIKSVEEIHIEHTNYATSDVVNWEYGFIADATDGTPVFNETYSRAVYGKPFNVSAGDIVYIYSSTSLTNVRMRTVNTRGIVSGYLRTTSNNDAIEVPSGIIKIIPMVLFREQYLDLKIKVNEPFADSDFRINRTITPPRPLNAIGEYKDIADVESGEWKYSYADIDLGDLTWNGSKESRYSSVMPLQNAKLPVGIEDIPEALCSRYRVVKYANEEKGEGITIIWETSYAAGRVWVRDAANTVLEFTEAIRGSHLLYRVNTTETEPISPDDLAFLRSLETLPTTDHITITDQNGEDCSYVLSYLVKLSEVN